MMFLLLGVVVSILGTLIGSGGGFILVPILLFLHPEMDPSQITAISLFCVTLSAISGSIQHTIQKRIHFKPGLIFAFASLPGAWIGVNLTHYVARDRFELINAILFLVLGVYLLTKKKQTSRNENYHEFHLDTKDYAIGAGASIGVGFVASFFGIGGGIIHVPLLSQVLKFPILMATATAQFILAITSLAAVIQHCSIGSLNVSQSFVVYLAVGMVTGAQFGSRLSKRVNPEIILHVLAVAIMLVAGRTLYLNFY